MWVKIKSMDGSKTVRIDKLSKLTKIEELRQRIEEEMNTPPHLQRLFFNGKQMEDGYTLFDYDVALNSIIQLMVRAIPLCDNKIKEDNGASSGDESVSSSSSSKENKPVANGNSAPSMNGEVKEDLPVKSSSSSKYYRVKSLVDARDRIHGAWFEAVIEKIEDDPRNQSEDGLLYHVKFEDYESDTLIALRLQDIRPRASKVIPFEDLQIGSQVMVNYNPLEPASRGYWYDFLVKEKKENRSMKQLIGTIFVGHRRTKHENSKVITVDQIFEIPSHRLLSNQSDAEEITPIKRVLKTNCSHCRDVIGAKCQYCYCHVCGGQDEPDKQIMCDECDMAYHLWCLKPPLEELPEEDEWFCPECKNDTSEVVHAGEKLKSSKKKAKMASAKSEGTTRDWGKGMACVGRSKVCTIVPPDHVGPIPGVEVGRMWKFRLQVSEAGVHRPHVAGMHGTEQKGALSIVLSGGYEDDKDDGDEFIYTGSGGRDLSGNKRTAEQSCDQKLTRTNRALASNCAAPLNDKIGATAEDWKKGKPVRVVRNYKGRKHSKYAPEEGNRYDGIYKVVKYWPEKGESGFLVWRYLLRRDDPTPAPWTKEGKKIILEKGFTMEYPEGYIPEDEEKKKKGKKRSSSDDETLTDDLPSKKAKASAYSIPKEVADCITQDEKNKSLWEECQEAANEGMQFFLKKVEETFLCICCQELAFKPITTPCGHNICRECLQRSFKAQVYSCPMCRTDLDKSLSMAVNSHLAKALETLFPGYEAAR